MPAAVTLSEAFSSFSEHWRPRVVGVANGQDVRVVKTKGVFPWHRHEQAEEVFVCWRGLFRVEFRDQVVELRPGQLVVVPRGVEHRTASDEEAEVLIFEPSDVVNTGDAAPSAFTAPRAVLGPPVGGPPARLTAAPTLQTSRLLMRAHAPADFPALVAMWGDERVTKHIGIPPSKPTETWARLLRYAGLWPLLGYGFWAVVEKASGRFAGEVGLADFQRDTNRPIGPPETGWALTPWAQGRGYATEAMAAALAWADEHLEAPSTSCIIEPSNASSIRVALKCGYAEDGQAVVGGVTLAHYSRPRRGDR